MDGLLVTASRGQRRTVTVGGEVVFGTAPIVIAGPCSVESAAQIEQVAVVVRQAGGQMLRGGAFKPRTSPYSFQGLGEEGLRLLAGAGRMVGLPVVTEVLDVRQADLVARHADMLQVGARNMHNAPLLREVAQCGKPVLLKRGFSATIEEWLLAAEYILLAGNDQVVLCERGIRSFDPYTRNILDLGAVAVVKQLTGLPVIADPSHAAGRSELVPALARASLAVGADGLLLEVHPDPERALSDGKQSLSLAAFRQLMEECHAGVLLHTGGRSRSPLEE